MHHRHFKRVGATALLAIAGLLGSLLIAPAAPAATINACQKKKGGTIRIVTSKTKCKKTEKKIKWSTDGLGRQERHERRQRDQRLERVERRRRHARASPVSRRRPSRSTWPRTSAASCPTSTRR